MIEVTLPFPPTVNSYWRSPPGRGVMISEKGRAYRYEVAQAMMLERARSGRHNTLVERLSVHVDAYPPRAGRRDLDNLLKALLDAMQHAGIYADDSQIDNLSITRREVSPPGFVNVKIDVLS